MKEEYSFSVGDKFWNRDFDYVCTVEKVSNTYVSFKWKSIKGNRSSVCEEVLIEQALRYRKEYWIQITPLLEALC